jgi:predicted amidophosphoribosyltransferase
MRDLGIPRLLQVLEGSVLQSLFGPDVTLVPVPGSAPLQKASSRWPSMEIAEALVGAGLASRVLPALSRTVAVPKSAFASAGQRPTARRHYETIRVDPEVGATERLLLVDDVVTKGKTLLGAASRLSEGFPERDIRGFALLRTLGLQPEIERILDPVLGVIELRGDEAWREP